MPNLSELVSKAYAAKADAPPADDRTALGAAYEDYVGGPAHDFISNFLAQNVPNHPLNDVISGLVPETTTGAGMLLGSLLVPEAKMAEVVGTGARNAPKLMNALGRIAGPTIGGAAGGLAEKGDPGDSVIGGVLGTLTGVGAEAGSLLSQWMGKSGLAKRFFKEDPQRVGRVVNSMVKDLPPLTTPEDFGAAFWGTAAQDKLSEMYGKELTAVSKSVSKAFPQSGEAIKAADYLQSETPIVARGGRITSPRIRELQAQKIIGGKSDFDSLTQAIKDLRLKGRAADGDPKLTLDGRQARDYAADISDDIKQALRDFVSPQAARRYTSMDRRYARGAEMIRYMKQPGVVDENGRLDMGLLQQQLKEERRAGLSHDFSPDEMKQLTDAVFRGASPTATDILARKSTPHLRVHASEGVPKASIVANLLDMIRGNDFAGSYDLGLPYIGPKALQVGEQVIGGAAYRAADRPITLRKPAESDDSSR